MTLNKVYTTHVSLASDVDGGTVIESISGSSTQLTATTFLTGPPGPQGPAGDGTPGPAGADGLDGAPGSVIRNGSGAPDNSVGLDGDYYIDTLTGNLYYRTANIYLLKANFTGPAGGVGPAGPAGTSILSGAGAPSNSLGNNGDFYIDTSTTKLYGPKAGGTWPAGVSLVGPAASLSLVDTNGVTWVLSVGTDGSLITTGSAPGSNTYGSLYGSAVYA
jgi:hypothetical protein